MSITFTPGLPHVKRELDFRENRHSLHAEVPNEEELKREFGQLAHAAIFAVTRGKSVQLAQVDDWIDHLDREGKPCDGDIRKLLIVSKDYLRAISHNELGLGKTKRAKQFRQLAAQFAKLHARFFGEGALAPDALSTTENLSTGPQAPSPPQIPPGALDFILEAMNHRSLNVPKLATEIRALLRRKRMSRLKADRATIYRIVRGRTKWPNPALRDALIEVLRLPADKVEIVRHALTRPQLQHSKR